MKSTSNEGRATSAPTAHRLPRVLSLLLSGLVFAGALLAGPGPIQTETVVDAPLAEVWEAWTTEEGLKSFFAPAVKVRLEVGGPFEIYFDPSAPEGSRGSEGSIILAFEKDSMLSFTWNSPPSMPEIRKHKTHVIVRFYRMGENQTKVTLDHDGWGASTEWMKAKGYFERAWGEFVLPKLRERFSER